MAHPKITALATKIVNEKSISEVENILDAEIGQLVDALRPFAIFGGEYAKLKPKADRAIVSTYYGTVNYSDFRRAFQVLYGPLPEIGCLPILGDHSAQ